MTPIERAREAAARAVLQRRIKDDFYTMIQHADGSRTWAVSHDQELADAALGAFLASLAEDGMVLVPRAEITKLCDYADRGQGYYYQEFVCDDEGEADAKEWSDFVDRIRAMIEAATSPPPPKAQG